MMTRSNEEAMDRFKESWRNQVSNLAVQQPLFIPYSWDKVRRETLNESDLLVRFKMRLIHRFPSPNCVEAINLVFGEDRNWGEISENLSDDVRMMYYLYQIALSAKEMGTLLFKDSKDLALKVKVCFLDYWIILVNVSCSFFLKGIFEG